MRRLLIILVLMAVLTDISPSSTPSRDFVSIDREFGTVIVGETTIIATRLVPPSFIADYIFKKQLHAESRGNHLVRDSKSGELRLIRSPAGALGIAQFLPSTWEWLKTRKVLPGNFLIENEDHQRTAQRLFMNQLFRKNYGIKYNRVKLALASYNAGSGRVKKLIKKYGYEWESHLPKETKKYIKVIMG